MNLPDLATFWGLVADSRLVDPGDLRRFKGECRASVAAEAAKWLAGRGVLSTWQARRLARGDRGPFFIGSFRLMERIDAEGDGLLFRVRDEQDGRRLQLRLLDRPSCKRREVWTGIVRRTTLAHAAASPLLSRTISIEKADAHRFILCEDLSLAMLAEELERSGGMGIEEAGRIATEVARAVAGLHRLGDVHGAISLEALRREPVPAMVDPQTGVVRLAQFPLAGDPHLQPPRLPIDSIEAMQKLGSRVCFAAPELATNGVPCDPRSDVYAIGCVVHALVTGRPPGWLGDPQRTLAAAARGLPPLVLPGGAGDLAGVVATMTARDPRSRFPSAVEAADALAACLGVPPASTMPPPLEAAVPGATSAVQAGDPGSASLSIAPPPFAAPTDAVPVIDAILPARPRSSSVRRRRPIHSATLWTTVGLLVVAVAGIVGIVFALQHGGVVKIVPSGGEVNVVSSPRDGAKPPPASVARSPEAADVATGSRGQAEAAPSSTEIVDDDRLPWASPTSGPPPTLAYLPPGSQLILVARPAEIMGDAEGALFVRSLGPQVAAAVDALARLCGCGLEGIEMLQAGWQQDASGAVLGGYTVWLREPAEESTVTAAVAGATTTTVGTEVLHVGKGSSLWMPTVARGRVVVCGDETIVRSIMEGEAKARPPGDDERLRTALPRDMEVLVGMLDRTRHVTLLGSPHALRTDARDMLVGPLARIADPLGDFLDESVRAAALSLHFGESLYVELDAVETVEKRATPLAKQIVRQLVALADTVEDWSAGLVGVQYGRKLVNRLPAMVRVLAANARGGAEGRGAVINAYVPRHAGHNLALAMELALAQADAAGSPAVRPHGQAADGGGIRQKLGKTMSLIVPRDTLEGSIQQLGEQVGLSIEILGNDLKLEGITKNQSFGLDERDKPAEEILRTILLKANPNGKLVYVIRGTGDAESLVVTTRAAAAERSEALPPTLQKPAGDTDEK
jgi:serine/threonine protein kinase